MVSTLPPDAKVPTDLMPSAGELRDLTRRFGELSDALHDPEGLLHRLLAAMEEKAAERHRDVLAALATVANGQVDISGRLQKLEPEVERHDAKLKLVDFLSNGNGADR